MSWIFWNHFWCNLWCNLRCNLLSVQNHSFIFSSFKSFFNRHAILTESTAAFSSSLGIDMNFLGTTLDFPSNRLQWTLPVSLTILISCTVHSQALKHQKNDGDWHSPPCQSYQFLYILWHEAFQWPSFSNLSLQHCWLHCPTVCPDYKVLVKSFFTQV